MLLITEEILVIKANFFIKLQVCLFSSRQYILFCYTSVKKAYDMVIVKKYYNLFYTYSYPTITIFAIEKFDSFYLLSVQCFEFLDPATQVNPIVTINFISCIEIVQEILVNGDNQREITLIYIVNSVV